MRNGGPSEPSLIGGGVCNGGSLDLSLIILCKVGSLDFSSSSNIITSVLSVISITTGGNLGGTAGSNTGGTVAMGGARTGDEEILDGKDGRNVDSTAWVDGIAWVVVAVCLYVASFC